MSESTNFQTEAKHVISNQTVHPVGEMFYDLMMKMVELGILEYRETADDNQYRWNPEFKGSWEK